MKPSEYYKPGNNYSENTYCTDKLEKLRIQEGVISQVKNIVKKSAAGKDYEVIRFILDDADKNAITICVPTWNKVIQDCDFDIHDDEELTCYEIKHGEFFELVGLKYKDRVAGRAPKIAGPWYTLDNEALEPALRLEMEEEAKKAIKGEKEEEAKKDKKPKKDKGDKKKEE